MRFCTFGIVVLLALACGRGRRSDASPPPAETLHVYFGNLHSHTSYSDGSGTPEQAYRHARDVAHLDFLAITEHNHAKAENGIHSGDPRRDGVLIATSPQLYHGRQPGGGTLAQALIPAAGRFTADAPSSRSTGRSSPRSRAGTT